MLVDYLEGVRALLTAHAHVELVAISGQDRGWEAAPWREWLERQGCSLPPTPYSQRTAPMRVWEEEILVAAEPQEVTAS